jgi:hypothetical protein
VQKVSAKVSAKKDHARRTVGLPAVAVALLRRHRSFTMDTYQHLMPTMQGAGHWGHRGSD